MMAASLGIAVSWAVVVAAQRPRLVGSNANNAFREADRSTPGVASRPGTVAADQKLRFELANYIN